MIINWILLLYGMGVGDGDLWWVEIEKEIESQKCPAAVSIVGGGNEGI